MKELVIASNNLHKVRELKNMLKEFKNSFEILSLRDFPDYSPGDEDGETFEENATKKALHAAKALGTLVIADDSGLVVPALNNEPGIFSARYAGEKASDKDNRVKLLEKLSSLPEEKRSGYFECCIALANENGLIKCLCGTCEGTLTVTPRGSNGFGYDPLFVKYDYSKTFAELDDDIKERISHRRKALEKLIPTLQGLQTR